MTKLNLIIDIMDNILYNNVIAKFLFSIIGNKSYAIGPIIITSLESGSMGRRTMNHLLAHTRQWTELFILTMFIGLFVTGFSIGLLELSILMYYILYIVEVFVRSVIYNLNGMDRFTSYGRLRALEYTSFEREAMDAGRDPNYHNKMTLFNWVKYLK